jgi:hypothetical protein
MSEKLQRSLGRTVDGRAGGHTGPLPQGKTCKERTACRSSTMTRGERRGQPPRAGGYPINPAHGHVRDAPSAPPRGGLTWTTTR